MKEQNKTPQKDQNKMEISNLSDAEFKTLVIKMLKELTEYFNSIKKTQEEMKATLSKIQKNVQKINSKVDEAKNQINDLEHKEEKNIQSEQQELKRIKNFKKRIVNGASGTTSNIPTFES